MKLFQILSIMDDVFSNDGRLIKQGSFTNLSVVVIDLTSGDIINLNIFIKTSEMNNIIKYLIYECTSYKACHYILDFKIPQIFNYVFKCDNRNFILRSKYEINELI